jgi:transcriptional regulator with XRE-family HTH domain
MPTTSSEAYYSYTTFGDLLKYLRRRERLTQLDLSITVGYSEAQISRLEKGLRLPDLTAIKALFIPALHLDGEPQLIQRFVELAKMTREVDAPAPGIPPYKGLLFFDELDADLFFGREELTAQLVKHIFDLAVDNPSRFMAVVGDSGSGKSSLMRAGLAVAIKRAGWEVCVFTPTDTPMKVLEGLLNSERIKTAEQVLVIVDQFEEAFTLCHDELERIAFIEKLLLIAQERKKHFTVVIALRSDFYSHCAQYPHLRQAVATEQEFIGEMTFDELRRAIEEPARRGGWEFESGLVDVMLNDLSIHGSREPEPGALPLLSHALLTTWESRRGRKFTLEGYNCSGGVRGAIAETAESIFTDQLDQAQQEIAHDVFLRLTELGDGTEDTRRRARLNELLWQHTNATQLRTVLNILAEARLITLNEDTVEVAHEALIREWERLHEWLTQDRESLLLHRHLTQSSHEWEMREHDSSELYRGARLAQVREWALVNGERLNVTEKSFLSASIEQAECEVIEHETQRMRELEATREIAETQKKAAIQLQRRAIYLLGALILALIGALAAGIFANRNSDLAMQNASIAQTAQAVSSQAIIDFTNSEAQRLAAAASSLSRQIVDPQLIALLSLHSIATQYTVEGDISLTEAATLPIPKMIFTGHGKGVYSVIFSPEGNLILTGSYDGLARLFDAKTGQEVREFTGFTKGVRAIFSQGGQSIFISSVDGKAQMLDVKTGKVQQSYYSQGDPGLTDIKVSPDGKYVLTGGGDGIARLWDAKTGAAICQLKGHTDQLREVAFSPDGRYIATSSIDLTARLWKTRGCELLRVFTGHTDELASVDFSPDGKYVVTGSWDNTARLWDVNTGQELRQYIGHGYWVNSVRFSPDGKFLLTGSCDKTAKLWDVQSGQVLHTFSGHTNYVLSVAFSHDGRYILTAGHDKTAWLWICIK